MVWNIKRKKAQGWPMSATAKLILGLLFLVAVLFLAKKVGDAMTQGYDKQICKTTVITNSKIRLPVAQTQSFDINCPTRYVTFGRDEITYESGELKTTEDIKCKKGLFTKGTSEDIESKKCFLNKANSIIADLIFDCWDQTGAGQLRLFSNYDLDAQCLLCSRISFSKDVQELFKQDLNGNTLQFSKFKSSEIKEDYTLQNYMVSHNPALHKITYYQFCMDETDSFKLPVYDYGMDKAYAVVFVAMNENAAKQALSGAWNSFKSWWDGTNPKEDKFFTNTLEFLPYDEVVNKCSTLV